MFGPNSVFLKFWSHIQTKTQIPANPNPDLNSEKNELVKEQVLTVQGGVNVTHCQVTKPPPPPSVVNQGVTVSTEKGLKVVTIKVQLYYC